MAVNLDVLLCLSLQMPKRPPSFFILQEQHPHYHAEESPSECIVGALPVPLWTGMDPVPPWDKRPNPTSCFPGCSPLPYSGFPKGVGIKWKTNSWDTIQICNQDHSGVNMPPATNADWKQPKNACQKQEGSSLTRILHLSFFLNANVFQSHLSQLHRFHQFISSS